MNKLEMAHDYAKIMLESGLKGEWDLTNLKDIAVDAFLLADAMQAEADKRKPNPVLPALHQTFIDGVEQPRYAEEWQPDWDELPNNANYFAMDKSGMCNAYENKPEICDDQWDFGDAICECDSFGYQGDWRDSLRKRPE